MTSYVIHDYELEGIIQAAGDQVRGAFGKGNMEKASDQLFKLEQKVYGREFPDWATHFAALSSDEDGEPYWSTCWIEK